MKRPTVVFPLAGNCSIEGGVVKMVVQAPTPPAFRGMLKRLLRGAVSVTAKRTCVTADKKGVVTIEIEMF